MKNNLRLAAFIFAIVTGLFLPRLSAEEELPFPNPETVISMDFKDASLKDILKIFSIQSGLNFIANEGLQERKVTLYLDKVAVKEAIDKLFKANNLSYELDKQANIILVKDWGTAGVETVTRVFTLKYATVSSSTLVSEKASALGTEAGGSAGITVVIKSLLSGAGSVIEDPRTNSLIITDIPSKIVTIARAIAALDISVPQVMLEVEMLDVSKNTTDKLGIKFGQSPITLSTSLTMATIATRFPFGQVAGAKSTIAPGSFNPTSSPSTYTIVLDFLKTQSDTKFLARPRILTLNNETAEIKIATQESVGLVATTASSGGSATGTSTSEAERVETGVHLRVTPQINLETGEVTMFINPKVAEAVAGNPFSAGNSGTFQYRDPEERSTKSIVRVKDGETVIIGGLIRKKANETLTKLPFLGDIPIFGKIFTHKNKDEDRERELLVFITPHIIKDSSVEIAQAPVAPILVPEREQAVLSGVGRQAVISNSLNAFERKNK
ncbi:MAG: secretin N-terminal domain-containing protein [Candidatus Omnitrophota bacterium]